MPGEDRFTIEELTGSQRSISLGGRALPYRGVAWGASMRIKRTWYAGNPRGTIQVLGPEYEDTQVDGAWKDRFVGRIGTVRSFGFDLGALGVTVGSQGSTVGEIWSADALVAAFYSILNAGNALRVSWRAEVREGVLVEFIPTYGRPTGVDVEWTMKFAWNAVDAPPATAGAAAPEPRAALRQELNDVDAASDGRPTVVNNAGRAQVSASLFNERSIAGQLFDGYASIAIASGPSALLAPVASVLSATEQMREVLDDARTEIESVPVQALTLSDRAVDLLNVDSWRRTLDYEWGLLQGGCLLRATSFQQQVAPGSLRIVTLPGATTLRTLSLTYYGTADSWEKIADVNGFTDSTVPAGTSVIIP